MENNDLISRISSKMSCELDKPRMPVARFVDLDITSSFAHLVPNLPSEELFGYMHLNNIEEIFNNRLNISLYDYDGILPENEKPPAGVLETPFRKARPRLFLEDKVPVFLQKFDKQAIKDEIDKFDFTKLAKSSVKAEDKDDFTSRVLLLINTFKKAVDVSSTTCGFLSEFRKNILNICGTRTFGIPGSNQMDLFAQKLQEDLEAGFKFYKELRLPREWENKHMTNSNEGTYLFKGITEKRMFSPVKFYRDPDRFEFLDGDKKVVIFAEECPEAMRRGILFPTVTMLTYIVLSPARKSRENERKTRIHIGGTHMASEKGYARELIPCVNEGPAYDRVELIYTGYDGRGKVMHEKNVLDSIGIVMPHLGIEGIVSSLKTGLPFTIDRSFIYKNGK